MRRPIDADEFRRLAQQGATNRELAEHFGCTPTYVTRLRIKHGTPSPNVPALTDEQHEQIRAMLADGCSHSEIARTANTTPQTIAHHYPGTAWTNEQAAEYRAAIREYTARTTGFNWATQGIYRQTRKVA